MRRTVNPKKVQGIPRSLERVTLTEVIVQRKILIANTKNLLHSFFSRSTFAPVQGLGAHPDLFLEERKGAGSLWACFLALGDAAEFLRRVHPVGICLFMPLPQTELQGLLFDRD
jgi:hypothetical protein